MNLWHQYVCPTTVVDALRAMRDAPAPAAPIAGGTDLLLDLAQGRHGPTETLIDLSGIAEMAALEQRGAELFIGAAVSISRIATDPLILRHASALSEACALIGGPQVRNVASLGGNVAHALPAADGTVALIALDAIAEIASLSGARRVPVQELFAGPGKSMLVPGKDLIVGFHLRTQGPGEGSAFRRVMRPQGVALPIINGAVCIQRVEDRIDGIRLVIAPSGPTPQRAVEAELSLTGKVFSEDLCRMAADQLSRSAAFRSSPRRASDEYRRHLVGPLVLDALRCAWERTWL